MTEALKRLEPIERESVEDRVAEALRVLIGEICARQCRIENFEGHARSCDVRVEKYGTAALEPA